MRLFVMATLAVSTLYFAASTLAKRETNWGDRKAVPAEARQHKATLDTHRPLPPLAYERDWTEAGPRFVPSQVLLRDYAMSSAKATVAAVPGQVSYTFPVRYTVPGTAGAVGIGDVTGDRKPEVVVAVASNLTGGRLLVFGTNAAGALEEKANYDLGDYYNQAWAGLVLGDFNRDQVMDVAVGMPYGIAMLLSEGGVLTLRKIVLGRDIHQVVALDVDYDDCLDIVGLSWGNITGMYEPNAATVLRGDGAGGIASYYSMATPQRGRNDLKVGDVTSDGHPDLVIASGQAFNIFVVAHDGVGGFLAAQPYAKPDPIWATDAVAIADINSDNRADVVANLHSNSPVSSLWSFIQGSGGKLLAPQRINSIDLPGSMVSADLNGDGLEDIATVHEGYGEMGYYLQNAGGGLGPEQRTPVVGLYASGADSYNRQGMAAGDITGDGCPDIALGDYNYGLVVIEGRDCLPKKPRVTGGNSLPRRQ